MVRQVFIRFAVLILLLLSRHSASAQTAAGFLKSFYTAYITNCDTPAEKNGEPARRKLIRSSCTARLIRKLDKADIEADPFLNAQDCSRATLSTLMVEPAGRDSLVFRVSYKWSDGKPIRIKLRLLRQGSGFRIDELLDPPL